MALPFELLLSLFLVLVALGLILDFLLDETVHALDLCLVLNFLLLDTYTVPLEEVDLVLAELVLLVGKLLKSLSLSLNEFADAVADKVLCLQLLFQDHDLLLQLKLFLVKDTGQSRKLALDLALAVLNIELLLCLGLVDGLLEIEDLLIVLVGLLRILILSTLKVVIQALDLLVQVLFVGPQAIELALGVKACSDILTELTEGELSKLSVELLKLLDQVFLVLLDLNLIAIDIRVVLELTAQSASRVLELFRDFLKISELRNALIN